MSKRIKIAYFPLAFKWIVSPLLLGIGGYLAVNVHWAWGVLLFVLALIVLTTDYVTEIDLQQKRYRDYLSLLTIELNEESRKFRHLDRIIISKGNHSQNINTRSRSTRLDWSDFTGILVHDNDETLPLLTRTDKVILLKELKEFADYLQLGVEDRTTGHHHWIDMTKV